MTRKGFLLPLLFPILAAGCGDSEQKPEAGPPHGPPGGIVEVDPTDIAVNPGGSGGMAMAGIGASSGTAGGGSGGLGGGGGGGGTMAGTGGTGGSMPEGQLFLPDIPYEYVGEGSSAGLELVASTLQEGQYGPEWLFAVKNTGFDPICLVSVPAEFLDANGEVLSHSEAFINSPMWESFGGPTQCVGTGEVGMAWTTLNLANLDISKVAKVEHGFSGNINPDALKLYGITVTDIAIADFSDTKKEVTGKVHNGESTSYQDPQVWFYATDPAGRPIAEGHDIELVPLVAGGNWSFLMYVAMPIDQFVVYGQCDDN